MGVNMNEISDKARELVEEDLKVQKFIEDHEDELFKELEEFDSLAKDSRNDDMLFISEALPLASKIVHRGSTLDNYMNTKRKLQTKLPEADSGTLLSAITYLYLVDKGVQKFSDSKEKAISGEEKKVVWGRIAERTKRYFSKAA